MGCLQSNEFRQQQEVNDQINKQIKEDKGRERKEIKLLLLGTGESGKSTVLKQIRIIHGGGYSREDRLATRDVVFSNVVQSMKIIVDAMQNFSIPLSNTNAQKELEFIQNLRFQVETDVFPTEISKGINILWHDAGVQLCFKRSREYQLNDSAKYYFDAIDRIGLADYLPTDEDILHSRVKTTGIVESTFDVEGQNYRIYDVGGQRSERRKWIHCFENVTALFFIVAVSEYDQKLVEDETTNRVRESINLFSNIAHNRWFENISIILFLNKIDIFNEKVHRTPIEEHFPDYKRDDSKSLEDSGYEFFKGLFEAEFRAQSQVGSSDLNDKQTTMRNIGKSKRHRELFVYPTCATDTTQMKNIISSVNQIIIQANLEDCGLL